MRGIGKAWMTGILLLALCIGWSTGTAEETAGLSLSGVSEYLGADMAEFFNPESELSEIEVEAEQIEETTKETEDEAANSNRTVVAGASSDNKTATKPGEARNITDSCTFKLCALQGNDKKITDGEYTTYWDSYLSRNPWIIIRSEEPMYGLYLCFRKMPESYEIQVPGAESGEWLTLLEGDTRFHHTFYSLDGLTELRIFSTQKDAHQMGFNEIFVFGKGEVPEWVQRWEPTEEKADILFFSAHPDDEILFYGGAIPYYAAEKEKRVVVAYLSYSNKTRRSEILNGLWAMGVRHYPEFGGFMDSWSNKLSQAYQKAGETKVLTWVAEMYRKHQPEVVVTHDLNGEYGHGQHKMLADAAIQCYDLAANPKKYPESYALYGTWQVKKLYVHLWGEEENQTKFDWNTPLESMGGKTGLDLAKEAYDMHVTQMSAQIKIGGKWHLLSVEETGTVFSNTTFGLYASQVGPDEKHTDFLEHIEND